MQTTNFKVVETHFHRNIRLTSGIFLGMEAGLLLIASVGFGVLALFFGGLSTVAGAGGVSDEKYHESWNKILLMITIPFGWTAMLALSAFLLMLGKRPVLVVIACVLAILGEWYFVHKLSKAHYHFLLELPALPPVIGIVVALWMIFRKRPVEIQGT